MIMRSHWGEFVLVVIIAIVIQIPGITGLNPFFNPYQCLDFTKLALPKCGNGKTLTNISTDGSADEKLIECCDAMMESTVPMVDPECWCVARESQQKDSLSELALAVVDDIYFEKAKFAGTSCGTLRNLNCSAVASRLGGNAFGKCHQEARRAVDTCRDTRRVIQKGSTSFFGLRGNSDKSFISCCTALEALSENKCLCKLLKNKEETNHATLNFLRFVEMNTHKIVPTHRLSKFKLPELKFCKKALDTSGCDIWTGTVTPMIQGRPLQKSCVASPSGRGCN